MAARRTKVIGANTPAENRRLIAHHPELVIDELATVHEPDPATFHRVLARKN